MRGCGVGVVRGGVGGRQRIGMEWKGVRFDDAEACFYAGGEGEER